MENCGTWDDETGGGGNLGFQAIVTVTQMANGTIPMGWTITFPTGAAPTAGSFGLRLDTNNENFDATMTAAIVDSAFGGLTSTTGNFASGFSVVYSADNNVHTLMYNGSSGLQPIPNMPAYEYNGNLTFTIPSHVQMWPAGGGPAFVAVAKTSTGDGSSTHTVFTLTENSHTLGGQFTTTLDGGTPSGLLDWQISDTDLATAITGCSCSGSWPGPITVTMSDYADHTLTVNSSNLISDQFYKFLAPLPQPVACISSIGGLVLSTLSGFNPTSGAVNLLGVDPVSGCVVIVPTQSCGDF
jgi:hypothetical protein